MPSSRYLPEGHVRHDDDEAAEGFYLSFKKNLNLKFLGFFY
jgi:hypothetical protein